MFFYHDYNFCAILGPFGRNNKIKNKLTNFFTNNLNFNYHEKQISQFSWCDVMATWAE